MNGDFYKKGLFVRNVYSNLSAKSSEEERGKLERAEACSSLPASLLQSYGYVPMRHSSGPHA